ncbi:MAG: DNA replication/repair protein RecF [Actinobacteria bacterium]|nr:MAG: DNA replication/repair protein RecF [Actinomycetota bacterium]REK37350.1 MAG: DNA replication/repair protein RecF [Actinomycetota bacterium]
MRVDWLVLGDFRSYHSLDWKPEPGVNILVGPNGAGKTNLLEAVSYLATLRSFRRAPDEALIADDTDAAIIRAGISSDDRERLIEIEIPVKGARRTQVDKQRLRRTSDLLGVLRVVAFLPEDLDLIKRGPAYRRDLLDEIAIQLWPAAYVDQAEFDRALRQRNAFLKSGHRDGTTLDVWDARVAQAGGKVALRRARVVEGMEPLLGDAYREISSSDATTGISYQSSWPSERFVGGSAAEFTDGMLSALRETRGTDYERRVTTTGPQRDEPVLELDGHDARVHGSQGEQRTMALAIKLAAHRLIAEATDSPPVLLLDDVFSELDPKRSSALAGALPGDTQTLVTSARPDEVPVVGVVWSVDGGLLRE